MRKVIIAMVMLLLSGVPTGVAQEMRSAQDSFRRAIALHDSGDYDGAIAIYRELLKTMPENEQVMYELAFSTFAKGDMPETIRLANEGADRNGPHQVRYLELLGNAYDAQRRIADAIAAYQRGIKLDPRYPGIRYNLGVMYAAQRKGREAREQFERAIELDPNYASAHYGIAEVYRTDGYRVPAILAYGRFLALTGDGQRAAAAANNLRTLLNLGVNAEGPGTVNITVDPASKKDLGDFSALEMMAALASGSSHLPENASKSEFDREAETFALFLAMSSEAAGDMKRGFVAKTYLPFYTAMVKAEKTSAFAHVALAPLKLTGTDEWLTSHHEELAALAEWLRDSAKE